MKFYIPFVLWLLMAAGTSAAADSRPVIRQAIDDSDWYPFYYYAGPERKLEGLMTEMVNALFVKELGWQLIFAERPWMRAQNEVEEGEADFFITIPTEARSRYALVTGIPLLRLYLNLYTYADHPRLEQLRNVRTAEDIRNLDLVLVSNRGNGWIRANMEEQGVKTQWVAGDEEIIRFLALKRADAMIEVAPAINHRIEEMGLTDSLVKTDVVFGPIDIYVMVGKKSKFALRIDEINSALQRMQAEGVFEKLWSGYK